MTVAHKITYRILDVYNILALIFFEVNLVLFERHSV